MRHIYGLDPLGKLLSCKAVEPRWTTCDHPSLGLGLGLSLGLHLDLTLGLALRALALSLYFGMVVVVDVGGHG